jgi:hypothetical protein
MQASTFSRPVPVSTARAAVGPSELQAWLSADGPTAMTSRDRPTKDAPTATAAAAGEPARQAAA